MRRGRHRGASQSENSRISKYPEMPLNDKCTRGHTPMANQKSAFDGVARPKNSVVD